MINTKTVKVTRADEVLLWTRAPISALLIADVGYKINKKVYFDMLSFYYHLTRGIY